jgi:hypothetical protein
LVARDQHLAQQVRPVGDDAGDSGIEQPVHLVRFVDRPHDDGDAHRAGTGDQPFAVDREAAHPQGYVGERAVEAHAG